MNTMKRISIYLTAIIVATIGLLESGAASAGLPGKEVVGAWALVSATIMKNGKKMNFFGPAPLGQVLFDTKGNYTLVMMRSDIQAFANRNRLKGSPEENAAVVHGSIAHFGKYAYNHRDKTYTFYIKSCTFPNWNNSIQTRRLTVKGNNLYWVNPSASTGARSLAIILRRIK